MPDARKMHEPSAPQILASSYTADECTLLFHGKATKASKEMALSLRRLIDIRNKSGPDSIERTTRDANAARAFLTNAILARNRANSGGSMSNSQQGLGSHIGGIRPDLLIALDHRLPPKEFLIDITGVHDSNGVRLGASLRQLRDRLSRDPNRLHKKAQTPSVQQATAGKLAKFAPLINAADAAFERGDRTAKATLIPFVITNRGVIGTEAWKLMHDMCHEHVLSLPAGPPADGVKPSDRVTRVHRELKAELLITNAIGVGRILAGACYLPWALN
jgi:hypothetical protein